LTDKECFCAAAEGALGMVGQQSSNTVIERDQIAKDLDTTKTQNIKTSRLQTTPQREKVKERIRNLQRWLKKLCRN